MANIDDYNAKIETIMAIPDDKTLEPTMPVDTYLQEGKNLAKWSLMDAEALATIGIVLAVLNDLPVRAGALREAQSIWYKDRNSQLEAQREWAAAAPEAFAMRDELIHTFRYAYRNDAAILSHVDEIAAGNTNADMIQDLNDLSLLGKTTQPRSKPLISNSKNWTRQPAHPTDLPTCLPLPTAINRCKANRKASVIKLTPT